MKQKQIEKFVWKFPVDLPGGKFCVATADVPFGEVDIYDKNNAPKRKYWTSWKLFKRESNADKYFNSVYAKQRSHNLTQRMVRSKMISLN